MSAPKLSNDGAVYVDGAKVIAEGRQRLAALITAFAFMDGDPDHLDTDTLRADFNMHAAKLSLSLDALSLIVEAPTPPTEARRQRHSRASMDRLSELVTELHNLKHALDKKEGQPTYELLESGVRRCYRLGREAELEAAGIDMPPEEWQEIAEEPIPLRPVGEAPTRTVQVTVATPEHYTYSDDIESIRSVVSKASLETLTLGTVDVHEAKRNLFELLGQIGSLTVELGELAGRIDSARDAAYAARKAADMAEAAE